MLSSSLNTVFVNTCFFQEADRVHDLQALDLGTSKKLFSVKDSLKQVTNLYSRDADVKC
jgi:hypothetical protein